VKAAALDGVRVVDLSRLAPGPFCSMLLADFGADVVLVEPPGGSTRGDAEPAAPWELERDDDVYRYDALRRNKRSIVLDLKQAADRNAFAALVRGADVVLEGFRPGVAERLGASYEQCRALNTGVVYCSISGYGQDGTLAQAAGHDIDYIARAGVLASISSDGERPAIPLNLIADFAGGGLYAAFAIMVALFHRERTGEGQRIDLAMTDGALSLMTHAAGLWFARGIEPVQGRFFLTGGLPSYDVYRCRDGRWVAVGALERWFLADLCRLTGRPELAEAYERPDLLPEVRAHLERWFAERDGDAALAALGEGATCAAPVLSLPEALEAAEERGMVVRPEGVPQVAAAPRLSATPAVVRSTGPRPGEHDAEIREELARDAVPPRDGSGS
jgi:alpha-methylacyl-CoA racemase